MQHAPTSAAPLQLDDASALVEACATVTHEGALVFGPVPESLVLPPGRCDVVVAQADGARFTVTVDGEERAVTAEAIGGCARRVFGDSSRPVLLVPARSGGDWRALAGALGSELNRPVVWLTEDSVAFERAAAWRVSRPGSRPAPRRRELSSASGAVAT